MLFLDIPGELRNQVYSYIIPANWSLDIDGRIARSQNTLTLLRTCRQTRTEVHLLPYSGSTFSAMRPDILLDWLHERTTRQCAAIKNIEFRFIFTNDTPTMPSYLFCVCQPTFIRERLTSQVEDCLKTLTGLRRITLRGTTTVDRAAERSDLESVRKALEKLRPDIEVATKFVILRFERTSVIGQA